MAIINFYEEHRARAKRAVLRAEEFMNSSAMRKSGGGESCREQNRKISLLSRFACITSNKTMYHVRLLAPKYY